MAYGERGEDAPSCATHSWTVREEYTLGGDRG